MNQTVTPLCSTAKFFREHIQDQCAKAVRHPKCAPHYLQTRLELQRIQRKHVDICGECQAAEANSIREDVA